MAVKDITKITKKNDKQYIVKRQLEEFITAEELDKQIERLERQLEVYKDGLEQTEKTLALLRDVKEKGYGEATLNQQALRIAL